MQVKEDVAWLLEDASDGGWKPVRDDGHVKVRGTAVPYCSIGSFVPGSVLATRM